MKYVIRQVNNPKYSIIVPFSRLWCVEPFFENFNKMDIPDNSEIIFWIDTSEEALFNLVSRKAEQLTLPGVQVIWAKKGEHANDDVLTCRKRIIELHENLKSEIKGTVVVGLEDDTLPPTNAIKRLVGHLDDPQIGFAQGIEVGRRGYQIYGAWEVSENKVSSMPRSNGITDIDGGGFYCFATRAGLYKAHNFDQRQSELRFLGPDFHFVYTIKMKGFRCITDWDLPCIHITEKGNITVDDYHHIATWTKDKFGWRSKLIVI